MVDYLGWAATMVFVGSYFCARPDAMRRFQMIGAVMWMAYGVLMHAAPVVVANLLVLCAAAWTTTRASSDDPSRGVTGRVSAAPAASGPIARVLP